MANNIFQFHSWKEDSLYICKKAEILNNTYAPLFLKSYLKKKKSLILCQTTIWTKYFKPQNA